MNIIGDDNVNVDMQRAFVASFDAPQKFFSSHNEIAFRVIEPDCKTWSKYRMIRKTSMQKPKIKNAKTWYGFSTVLKNLYHMFGLQTELTGNRTTGREQNVKITGFKSGRQKLFSLHWGVNRMLVQLTKGWKLKNLVIPTWVMLLWPKYMQQIAAIGVGWTQNRW